MQPGEIKTVLSETAVVFRGEFARVASMSRLANCAIELECVRRDLGFPAAASVITESQVFPSHSAAAQAVAERVSQWTKDGGGGELCDTWAEHRHEKMSAVTLRLADDLKGKLAKQPFRMTLEYPEPYHLAKYINVTTEEMDGRKNRYTYKFPSALEAKRGAQSRIDAAALVGYNLEPKTENGALSELLQKAAVKLLLDAPPAKEDWGPLVLAIEPRPMTGEIAIRFAIRTFQKSDARLRESLRKRQPIPMESLGRGPGVFYPAMVNEEAAQSQVVTVLAVGAIVGGKLVGGAGAAMPAMGVKKSFAEIHAKPEEPKAIRHIELE